MYRTPTSLAYRIAKWRLSQRPSKYVAALFLVLAIVHFALALSNARLAVFNALIAAGFLSSAYSEWEMIGFHEVLAEKESSLKDHRPEGPRNPSSTSRPQTAKAILTP